MGRNLLPRALRGCAFAGVLALAGCAATTATSTTVTGKNLSVYISDPAGLASDSAAQDVVDAEKLGCSQLKGTVTAFKVSCLTVTAPEVSGDAREAIVDPAAIAYLGEVVPGTSADSIGITNSQGLLQVSPTDSSAALTQSTAAVPGSPGRYYEDLSTYGHTFARMVPSSSHEAVALVAEMQALKVKTVHVESDGSAYGQELASVITSNAPAGSLSLVPSASGAQAIVFAGSARSRAASALDAAAAADPKVKLLVASALADQGFASSLSPQAQRELYAVSPGVSTDSAGKRAFTSRFRSTYGHAAAAEAIFGYAAIQAVLRVLAQAGSSAGDRTTVVKDFTRLRYAGSVLGPLSIDKNGDSSLRTFLLERMKAGHLVPVGALQG